MGFVIKTKIRIRNNLIEIGVKPDLRIKAKRIVMEATVSILLLVRSREYILENLKIPIIPKAMYIHDSIRSILYIISVYHL